MVQPTPQTLLRSAETLASKFNIFAHPRVPLSPQESRDLLRLLTTSFRQQLDQEHDSRTPNTAQNGLVSTPTASSPTSHSAFEKRRTRPSATPTDRHLNDILSNPLFSFQPPQTPKPKARRGPMDVFDEACARGLMNIDRARACLHAQKQLIQKTLKTSQEERPEEMRKQMKASGAGSQVLKWLLSTGAESNSSWLRSTKLGEKRIKDDIIFDFLVLEGKQEALFELFEHYATQKLPNNSLLIYQLSKSLAENVSINAGYGVVVRASEFLAKLEVPLEGRVPLLHNAISHLVNATKHIKPEHVQPSPAPFDQFIRIVKTNVPIPSMIPKAELFVPQLYLCHPIKPDAGPALRYIKSLESIDSTSSEYRKFTVKSYSDTLIWVALEAARQLLKNEKYNDGRAVMSFVQQRYPELSQHASRPTQNGGPEYTLPAVPIFLRNRILKTERNPELKSEFKVLSKPAPKPESKVTPKRNEADATSLDMLNNLELGIAGT